MIVDLRFNGGGDELLARAVAARFVDKKRVYSINQYRDGPKHDQLGPKLEREVEPRGPSVILTALASFETPRRMASWAS